MESKIFIFLPHFLNLSSYLAVSYILISILPLVRISRALGSDVTG